MLWKCRLPVVIGALRVKKAVKDEPLWTFSRDASVYIIFVFLSYTNLPARATLIQNILVVAEDWRLVHRPTAIEKTGGKFKHAPQVQVLKYLNLAAEKVKYF